MKQKYLIMLMLGTCISAHAQDTKPKESIAEGEPVAEVSKSAGEQIKELVQKKKAEQQAFMDKVRSEKDRKKAKDIYKNERPSVKGTLEKILELAKQDPGAKEVADGLIWGYFNGDAAYKKAALDILIKHHKDVESLSHVVFAQSRQRNPDEASIRNILYASNNEKVRQTAMLSLATILNKNPKSKAEGIAFYKQLVAWPNIASANPRIYSHAKSELFVMENLSVGCLAPDIVGTDQDDKEFKLSDYKGKVVLLDFWGIW